MEKKDSDRFFRNGCIFLAIIAALIIWGKYSTKKSDNHGFFSGNSGEKKVWICTGPYSKRYHRDLDCKGLQSCSGDTKLVTISDAEEMGRTPCGYCYGDATPNW